MGYSITYTEAMKEVRRIAKKNEMIFKRQNAAINGRVAYKFIDRTTGLLVGENFTLWSAYENCMSGYVDTMNK